MIIGLAGIKLFVSFTIFQNGRNNGVEIWALDVTRGISR